MGVVLEPAATGPRRTTAGLTSINMLLGMASVLSLASASAASAKDAAAAMETTPQGASEAPEGIGDIVVTAQKRQQSSQRVPISLSVLGDAELTRQNIQSVNQIGAKLPNVQVLLPYGDAQPQFVIRGVTSTDISFNQSGPIALYVDGVFKSVGALQATPMYDVERVEVLRGPQGTLQGRNSTGGAVQIYSKAPVFDTTGSVMAGIGDHGRYEAQAMINLPIVDDLLAVRFAGTYLNVDGYIKNRLPNAPFHGHLSGSRERAGRASLLFTPSPTLRLLLRASIAKSDPVNYGIFSKDIGPGGVGIPEGYFPGVGPTGFERQGLGFFENNSQYVRRRDIENQSFSLTADWDIGSKLKLTSITSYDKGHWLSPDNDAGSPDAVYNANFYSRVDTFQQEARLASSFEGRYNFILGAVYANEALDLSTRTETTLYQPAVIDIGGTPTNICLATLFYSCITDLNFHQIRRDRAAYFSNSLEVTDQLKLTVGARYTRGKVGISKYRTNVTYIDPATGVEAPPINLIPGVQGDPTAVAPPQTVINRKWSGNALVEYQISSRNLVYAGFSRGFRGSSFNAGAYASIDAINAVKPEVLDAIEIGSKNRFLDNRLQINVAAFQYSYKNQQFSSVDVNTGYQVQYNVPRSKLRGAELEVVGKPTPELNLQAGLGWLPTARYEEGIVNGIDIAGNRLVNTPRLSLSGSIDWKFFSTGNVDFNVFADANRVSGQYFGSDNNTSAYQPAYTLVNLRLTAAKTDQNLSLSFFVQNVFNKKYFVNILDYRSFLNFSFAVRGNPRSAGLQARYGF